jgi:hypothetical protein
MNLLVAETNARRHMSTSSLNVDRNEGFWFCMEMYMHLDVCTHIYTCIELPNIEIASCCDSIFCGQVWTRSIRLDSFGLRIAHQSMIYMLRNYLKRRQSYNTRAGIVGESSNDVHATTI